MPTLHHILVPVDFSHTSTAALDYALFLATLADASVDVLAVWELGEIFETGWLVQEAQGMVARPVEEFLSLRAGQQLRALVASVEHRLPGRVRGRLESGDPASRIVEICAVDHYDLIVMGTHGRTGFSHLFVGSVAEKVMRRAPCPILVVPRPATSS